MKKRPPKSLGFSHDFLLEEDFFNSLLTQGISTVLYLTGQGSKLGIDATKKLPGEGFKRPWPPLIKMDESVRKKMDALFGGKP